MAILSFYILIQFFGGDYKEMSAGIIAYGFTLLHFLRTFFGHWQTYCFEVWVVYSLKSICSFSTVLDNNFKKNGVWILDINKAADQVEINDSILENKLLDGEQRCKIMLYPKTSKTVFLFIKDLFESILNCIPLLITVLFDNDQSRKFFPKLIYPS